MIRYVVGFAMKGDEVLLTKKNRPPWQKDRLNGIGGKIEEKESPLNAMVREFEEETGIKTLPSQWQLFVKMGGEDYEIFFYRTILNIDTAKQITDEELQVHVIKDIPHQKCISNLNWLIPLCCDSEINFPIVIDRR